MQLQFPWVLEHTKDVTDVQWLIITGVGFLFVVFLIVKFVWPGMFRPHLVQRQQGIEHAAAQVESTLRETEQMRNDYKSRLDSIEEETRVRMADAEREAQELKERILQEAQQTAAALLRRGEDEVLRERAKAMAHLRGQFVRGVVGAAQFAASQSLNAAHQRRLVDSFVNDLGSKS